MLKIDLSYPVVNFFLLQIIFSNPITWFQAIWEVPEWRPLAGFKVNSFCCKAPTGWNDGGLQSSFSSNQRTWIMSAPRPCSLIVRVWPEKIFKKLVEICNDAPKIILTWRRTDPSRPGDSQGLDRTGPRGEAAEASEGTLGFARSNRKTHEHDRKSSIV